MSFANADDLFAVGTFGDPFRLKYFAIEKVLSSMWCVWLESLPMRDIGQWLNSEVRRHLVEFLMASPPLFICHHFHKFSSVLDISLLFTIPIDPKHLPTALYFRTITSLSLCTIVAVCRWHGKLLQRVVGYEAWRYEDCWCYMLQIVRDLA
ncbi:hypothetical protein MPER_06949 [Moniliophthora perniciosa FA553]|nr:hypothetical protein MPER_06949 [Moniliophthora perniciosa FA553]